MHHDSVFRYGHKPRVGYHPREPSHRASFEPTTELPQGGENLERDTGLTPLLPQEMTQTAEEATHTDERLLRPPVDTDDPPRITMRRADDVDPEAMGTSTSNTGTETIHQ